MMQPFRFEPIYQERIWGGTAMQDILHRSVPSACVNYGESWEISDRPDACSIVSEGPYKGKSLHELWTEHREELFGKGFEQFERFPLLCKILDAKENLSLQVHPPECTAKKLGGEVKNEIWYVMNSLPDSLIYFGIKGSATSDEIRQKAEAGTLDQILNATHLNKGEALYIPSGLVHAIGAGHLIAEIQQNSDTTYRLYDWGRTDDQGNPRELHLDQAITSIEEFNILAQDQSYLSDMPHFRTKIVKINKGESWQSENPEKFTIIVILEGALKLDHDLANMGDFLLAPAHSSSLEASSDTTLIVATM